MLLESTFQLLQMSSINVNIGKDLSLQRNTSCLSIFEAFLLLKLYFIVEILCSHDSQDSSLTRLERLKGKSASEIVDNLLVSLNELATRKIIDNSEKRRNLSQNDQVRARLTLICSSRSHTMIKVVWFALLEVTSWSKSCELEIDLLFLKSHEN